MRQRLYLLPALALMSCALFIPNKSDAQGYDPYPWCAQYNGRDGGGRNCGFLTYGQCMATISGIGGICEPNQFYTGRGPYAGPTPHERRAPKRYRNYRYEQD